MPNFLKKILSPYTVFARYLPSLLSALPFFVIWYFLSENVQLKGLASFILSIRLPYVKEIAFFWVFLHFYSLIIREISKYFERKYFTGDEAIGFPTTYLMMYSNSMLSDSYKDTYRKLILKRFDIELLNKKDEGANIDEARKRLDEATGLVREELKDGYLVLKHNIWFGSLRNLIGGTIISIPVCISGIALGGFFLTANNLMIATLAALFTFYLPVFLFRRTILVRNAEGYATQLISEFIGSEIRK
jgi:hypothetical protein